MTQCPVAVFNYGRGIIEILLCLEKKFYHRETLLPKGRTLVAEAVIGLDRASTLEIHYLMSKERTIWHNLSPHLTVYVLPG